MLVYGNDRIIIKGVELSSAGFRHELAAPSGKTLGSGLHGPVYVH